MSRSAGALLKETGSKKKEWLEKIISMREMVLSNIIMLSQVPAQTFHEKERARFILDRFIESGLSDPRSDEIDNVIAVIPGRESAKRILLFAHMDHRFGQNVDQNVTITDERAQGTGVANDTAGLAVLMTLPDIVRKLDLDFTNDIVLVSTTRCHGKGDFEGMRTYISNNHENIDFAVNIGGVTLGKVDYFSLSRTRCDITIEVPDTQGSKAWGTYGQSSAVRVLDEMLSQLYSIRLPRDPKTVLNVGMVSGGEAYSTVSSEAAVGLEILSEDDKVAREVTREISDQCLDLEAKHGVNIGLEFFGRHRASGVKYSHPLVKSATAIVEDLGYQSTMEYSTSEISISLAKKIPSIHIGVTTGRRSNSPKSYIELEPLSGGILQIIMLLYAMDRGYCDEKTE